MPENGVASVLAASIHPSMKVMKGSVGDLQNISGGREPDHDGQPLKFRWRCSLGIGHHERVGSGIGITRQGPGTGVGVCWNTGKRLADCSKNAYIE